MSQQLVINGKKFKPSAELARQFGYSMDYISRLAREGKVEATRVGRQWFVDALSLENFVEQTSKQKEFNREQLRTERKLELISYSKSTNTNTTDASLISNSVRPVNKKNYRESVNIILATTGTALVLMAGLLSVVVINPNEFYSFFSNFDFNNQLTVQRHSDVTAGALGAWIEPSDSVQIIIEDKSGVPAKGVVVFDEKKSEKELERIKASFSDEVEINFSDENTGVITPVFINNEGDEYQFLMVPINDAS